MSSELVLDQLTGRSSAGSIAVTAEGGTVTTNLQQGLAKQWSHVSADGQTENDKFNTTSVTDTTTGTQTVNIASNFSNALYSCHLTLGGNVNQHWIQDQLTGSFVSKSYNGSNFVDSIQRHLSHGDLA